MNEWNEVLWPVDIYGHRDYNDSKVSWCNQNLESTNIKGTDPSSIIDECIPQFFISLQANPNFAYISYTSKERPFYWILLLSIKKLEKLYFHTCKNTLVTKIIIIVTPN